LEAKSNIWREAGVPIPDVSTLVGATGGTLALQLLSLWTSESMGNHDSNVMGGADSVD